MSNISKVEQAKSELPTVIKRENFKTPGDWGRALMEYLTRYWEDQHLYVDAILKIWIQEKKIDVQDANMVRNRWRNFRSQALNYVKDGADEKTPLNFVVRNELWHKVLPDWTVDEYGKHDMFAFDLLSAHLFGWQFGRRIYSLDEEAVRLFRSAELMDFTWKEIPFPFNSFLIELDKPIELVSAGTKSDYNVEAILVNRVFSDKDDNFSVIFNLIISNPGESQLTDQLNKTQRKILQAPTTNVKKMDRFDRVLADFFRNKNRKKPFINFGATSDMKLGYYQGEGYRTIFKIVAGACLYLNSKKSIFYGAESQDSTSEPNKKTVKSEDEIYKINVKGEFPDLSSFVNSVSGIARKSPETHARAAHRRKVVNRNTGEVRLIDVAATIVNATKLKEGENHGGKAVIIKS